MWESEPLVAVKVTVKMLGVPAGGMLNVQAEAAVMPAGRGMGLGVHDNARPVEGVAMAPRVTLPPKPPRLVRVIVVFAVESTRIFRAFGLAVMAKSAVAPATGWIG